MVSALKNKTGQAVFLQSTDTSCTPLCPPWEEQAQVGPLGRALGWQEQGNTSDNSPPPSPDPSTISSKSIIHPGGFSPPPAMSPACGVTAGLAQVGTAANEGLIEPSLCSQAAGSERLSSWAVITRRGRRELNHQIYSSSPKMRPRLETSP